VKTGDDDAAILSPGPVAARECIRSRRSIRNRFLLARQPASAAYRLNRETNPQMAMHLKIRWSIKHC